LKGEKKMTTKDMTKDELKKELTKFKTELNDTIARYNELTAQATLMEKEHSRRLAYLRSFERFANTIDQTMTQLKGDIGELNRMFSTVEDDTDGGE